MVMLVLIMIPMRVVMPLLVQGLTALQWSQGGRGGEGGLVVLTPSYRQVSPTTQYSGKVMGVMVMVGIVMVMVP